MELQHLHYRRMSKGEMGASLVSKSDMTKILKDKFVNINQAVEDLDAGKRLETPFAFYQI